MFDQASNVYMHLGFLLFWLKLTIQFLFQGKRVFFATNNSSKSRMAYLKKFEKFGIVAYEVKWKNFLIILNFIKQIYPF